MNLKRSLIPKMHGLVFLTQTDGLQPKGTNKFIDWFSLPTTGADFEAIFAALEDELRKSDNFDNYS